MNNRAWIAVTFTLLCWSWIVSKYDVGEYLHLLGRIEQVGNNMSYEKITWGKAYRVYVTREDRDATKASWYWEDRTVYVR